MHPSRQHQVACNKLNKHFSKIFVTLLVQMAAHLPDEVSHAACPIWPLLLLKCTSWLRTNCAPMVAAPMVAEKTRRNRGNLLNVLSNIRISHVVKVKSMKDMGVGVKVWISWSVDLHFFTPLSPNWELPAYTRSWKQEDEYESHTIAELEAFAVVDPILGHGSWSRL